MTASSAAKCVITVTFNKAYAAAPKSVILQGATAASAYTVQPYISATATTTFTITFNVAAGSGTAYKFYYLVIE